MQKRTKLLILIVVALALLIFGIWYLLVPILQQNAQPPALPSSVTPNTTVVPKTTPTPSTQGASSTQPTPQQLGLKQIQDLASTFIARLGSGASGDGFQGYSDVLINATPSYQKDLLTQQRAMQQAHPAQGPVFGITTRVVSVDASQAVPNAASISFTLKVQQVEDAGNPGQPTRITYKQAAVTLERQPDTTYLVSNVVWTDILP